MEYGEYPQAREESVGQRRGMPHGLERLRRSSEEPPVDVVGVAAEIPKIVHQMLAMTRYAPPGPLKGQTATSWKLSTGNALQTQPDQFY